MIDMTQCTGMVAELVAETRAGRQEGDEVTVFGVAEQGMTDYLKPTAITFTKPLPLRALGVKDLISFAWSVVSGYKNLYNLELGR